VSKTSCSSENDGRKRGKGLQGEKKPEKISEGIEEKGIDPEKEGSLWVRMGHTERLKNVR